MCSDPTKPTPYSPIMDMKYEDEEDVSRNSLSKLPTSHSDDPEKAARSSGPDFGSVDLNHYRFINHVWHYNSVDFGPKCKLLLQPSFSREIV
jgi:hypothetical protein